MLAVATGGVVDLIKSSVLPCMTKRGIAVVKRPEELWPCLHVAFRNERSFAAVSGVRGAILWALTAGWRVPRSFHVTPEDFGAQSKAYVLCAGMIIGCMQPHSLAAGMLKAACDEPVEAAGL